MLNPEQVSKYALSFPRPGGRLFVYGITNPEDLKRYEVTIVSDGSWQAELRRGMAQERIFGPRLRDFLAELAGHKKPFHFTADGECRPGFIAG